MSTTKAHPLFIDKQKELHPDKFVNCRGYLTLDGHVVRVAISYTFDALLETLEEISCGSDQSKAIEATGLLQKIENFKFLLCLVMFDRILSDTRCLSED